METKRENPERYDAKLAQEAIVLAARLQDERHDAMTVDQIESVAQEIGVEPKYVAEALQRLQEKSQPQAKPRPNLSVANVSDWWDRFCYASRPGLWWATAWMIPAAANTLHTGQTVSSLGGLLYVGGGIFLSMIHKSVKDEEEAVQGVVQTGQPSTVSREELLQTMFTLQRQLEADKQTRAFLSVDVVASTLMKHSGSELAVEYSFRQYQRWISDQVKAEGGDVQSAAGDGMMCVFEKEETAVQVAKALLKDLPRFNREQNQLTTPFQIRCGVSVGEVALEPGQAIGQLQSPVVDLAAKVQKEAEPNTVQVGRIR